MLGNTCQEHTLLQTINLYVKRQLPSVDELGVYIHWEQSHVEQVH